MHVAYVVAWLVFTQSVEIEVVVDDFAAWLAFEISRNSGVECVQHNGFRVDEHVDLVDKFLSCRTSPNGSPLRMDRGRPAVPRGRRR